jgi:Co/Zn/Cd efflux system component|tara:strand:- start:423 stop:692 length:270 start_codon:yes stop_codon:yes gene_type:complete
VTAELALYAAFVALLINLIGLWGVNRMRSDQLRIVNNISHRLQYVELVLSHYEMIPLPWEMEDLDEQHPETKNFKHDGNVVYLQEKEED